MEQSQAAAMARTWAIFPAKSGSLVASASSAVMGPPTSTSTDAAPPVAALYDLWHDLTGGRGAVTLFDVAPLLDLVAPPLAPTVPVACALRSDGVFAITEVAESRVRATRRVLSAEDAAAAKGKLLDLLANAALAAL